MLASVTPLAGWPLSRAHGGGGGGGGGGERERESGEGGVAVAVAAATGGSARKRGGRDDRGIANTVQRMEIDSESGSGEGVHPPVQPGRHGTQGRS